MYDNDVGSTNETKTDNSFRAKGIFHNNFLTYLILEIAAGIFLAAVSGMSAIIGFSATLAAAKKQDPKYFNKGIATTMDLQTSGVNLAVRALAWGTFYAVTGTGLLCYSIWKLSGAKNVILFFIYMTNINILVYHIA